MAKHTSLKRTGRFIKIAGELIIVMTKCIAGITVIFLAVAITLAALLPCLPLAIYRYLKSLSST